MKKTILPLLLAGMMTISALAQVPTQELTVEHFTREMNGIWADYEREVSFIVSSANEYPDKQDSLRAAMQIFEKEVTQKSQDVAIRYAFLPEGLELLYRVRLDVPKDTLRAVLGRIPEELRTSPYGRSIARHIEEEQIKEGDIFYNFTAVNVAGEPFEMSSLTGKNILFLYGGIDCMGPQGQEFLYDLYPKTARAELEIVMYEPADSPEQLQNIFAHYPKIKFILVSDFLGDHSPLNIRYGVQATPTCFLINKSGKVILISKGLPVDRLTQF